MESVFWQNAFKGLNEKTKSQKWLADETGIALSVINSGIKRSSSPLVDHAFKIANALDVSVRFLLTGKEEAGLLAEEWELIKLYRRLDENTKSAVMGAARAGAAKKGAEQAEAV